jgi:hypothetical protein
MQQSFLDVRSATLTGLTTGDAVGNSSTADGQLQAPIGKFILSAGARSGGGLGTGGQSNAQAHCDTAQTYLITSATLPPGTLVPVTIGWALNGQAYAAGNLTYYTAGAMGELDGQVVVRVNGVPIMNKSGVYRRGYDIDSGGHIRGYDFVYGTLNMQSDFAVVTANVPVGQTVQVAMDMTAFSVTTAVALSTTGGDAEMAVLWGVSITGADAAAVLQSNPGEVAPSAANATPANAALAVPTRPAGSISCLEFSTQPAPLTVCNSDAASFSVVATGSGPFTYHWRRNAVAIDAAIFPSALTSTLSFNSVTTADVGLYDCVVTNACGSVPSNAATLTVNGPPSISQPPASQTRCPSVAATFSVAADGLGTLAYQWQWRALGGTDWLNVVDGLNTDPATSQPAFTATGSRQLLAGATSVAGSGGSNTPRREVRVVVSNSCGTAASTAATWTICPADFDCSGGLAVADIFAFLNAWFAGSPSADFDGIDGLQIADIFTFLNAWFAGC